MFLTPNIHKPLKDRVRINHQIRSAEVRLIGAEGENRGVVPLSKALEEAQSLGMDLIEISPLAIPPVAKIADYGKFQYELNKKQRGSRSKSHEVEVKSVQVKIGTSEHDLELKAKKASEWLSEGHRIKVDLFLPGRSKYLEEKFLKGRLDRILRLISLSYKVAEEPKKSPKGMSMVIERSK